MPPKFSPNALHATKIIGLQDIPPWSVDTTPPLPKNRRTVDWKKEKLPSTVHTFDPILNTKISLVRYDITRISVDAVVNAANGGMMGGGGIDGAIHAAAGPQLKMELAKLMSKRETKRVPSGSTVLSQGHKLPAKHILHTVGPIYSKQKAKTCLQQLISCYTSCLDLAAENGLRSIAFCSIGTGVFHYPRVEAAQVALATTREWLEKHPDVIDRVLFVVFMDDAVEVYQQLLPHYFPKQDNTAHVQQLNTTTTTTTTLADTTLKEKEDKQVPQDSPTNGTLPAPPPT
eukprot:TRINITY_DN59926_c0_g1_i1.p1 TRINITY_DN59926_c0_g1~~TRINITY_DN59926_c0_g1_i1.p1  ORF type:complete len:287 (+),score=33.46 TRINITY_DN59926_c0_g1_i1:45-905(+)